MESVTNKDHIVAKPVVRMRAGDLKKFDGKLTKTQQAWCDLVQKNNPPGQEIFADKAMVDALESQVKPKVKSANVQGQS